MQIKALQRACLCPTGSYTTADEGGLRRGMDREENHTESGSDPPEEALLRYYEALEVDEFASPEPFRAELQTEEQRKRFSELLAASRSVQSGLPRVLGPGFLLGRYRLGRAIGGGGMGQVFRARDEEMDRVVAVKVLQPDVSDPQFLERFEHEPRVLASLNHPNIVRVFDTGTDQGIRYVVTELLDGRPLNEVLHDLAQLGRLPLPADVAAAIGGEICHGRASLLQENWYETVQAIFRSIVQAVEAAHSRDVLHRDLKPANIMLQPGGHPVVLDFGLAKPAGTAHGDLTRKLYGSPPYLAPEQLDQAQIGADPSTDVYQLGLVLYEMLTLRPAYAGASIPDITGRISIGDFSAPSKVAPGVPGGLEAICLKAMHRKREQRYSTVTELGQDLDAFRQHRPLKARPPGAFDGLGLLARRFPVLTALAAATTLMLGLTIAMWGGSAEAPRVSGFALRSPEVDPVLDPDPVQPLSPGDCIGFEIRQQHPRAFSAFYVVPIDGKIGYLHTATLLSLGDWRDGSAEPRPILELDAGRHQVVAAKVDDLTPLESWPVELWVVEAADAESFDDERWKALAWETNRRQVGDGSIAAVTIPYERALEILREVSSAASRGDLGEAPARFKERFADPEKAARIFEEKDWPIDGQILHPLRFSVIQPH